LKQVVLLKLIFMGGQSAMVRKFLLVFVAVLMLASLGAVAAQDTTALRVAATAAITTWDPSLSFSTEALYLANLYEPLLWANPPGSDEPFTPALATSWEKSEDGLTWTFHLREGVKFHDGSDLTAQAVKDSIERHRTIGGAAFIWAPVDSVEVVDDLTVQFNMTYPAPLDLIASSLYAAWIVSPDALAAAAADEAYFEQGVDGGTGPYMLTDYTPDTEVVMGAFPEYWGGWDDTSHFENVVVSIVADDVVQEQLLLGGEVDLALRLPPTSYGDFASNPDFTVFTENTLFNYVGFLNTLRPPLDNPLVRQAISYALPYDDIIQVGAEGLGTQSRGPVPQGVFPHSEAVPQYTQDLDRARGLMAEAGYADGGIDLTLTYAAENSTEEAFAPVIADALADIGINVNIEPMLFNQQWDRAKSDPANAQDIFIVLYWPTYSDAGSDNLWSLFRSSEAPFFNLSYWVNEEYDALIDEAIPLSGVDRAAAQELYTQAMTLLVDQAPGLFLMDVSNWYAVPNSIAGFAYNLNYPFATFFYPIHPAAS
jgi:peptide/nickel transport system substrate-binding protein